MKTGTSISARIFLVAGVGPAALLLAVLLAWVGFQSLSPGVQRGLETEGHAAMAFLFAFVAAAIFISLAVARRQARELLCHFGGEPAEAAGIVARIAQGDLSGRIETGLQGGLLAALSTLQDRLVQMIERIEATAHEAAAVAAGLATAAGQVAVASERQTDSTLQVGAAIQQMTVSIAQVAHTNSSVHRAAAETGDLSAQGAASAVEAAAEVRRIADSVARSSANILSLGEQSSHISAIANVIREIAEQTNLLALNAAIEAARAGQQGRGFAVVADEVRKLAERTQSATREISSTIGEVQSCIDEAVDTMRQENDLVTVGVEKIARVNELIANIRQGAGCAAAGIGSIDINLGEQTRAAEQIATRMENITRMTDETRATVRGFAAGAEKMGALVGDLKAALAQVRR